jgi:hypothetical protein
LRTAIRLYFEGGDPVSIHTLVAAAHEILHELHRRKGFKGLLFNTPLVEKQEWSNWSSFIKKPANFFKHAKPNEKDESHELNTVVTETMMMACVKALAEIENDAGMEELALTYWSLFTMPVLLTRHGTLLEHPKIKLLQNLAAQGPEVYFREFCALWDKGLIRYGSTWPAPTDDLPKKPA